MRKKSVYYGSSVTIRSPLSDSTQILSVIPVSGFGHLPTQGDLLALVHDLKQALPVAVVGVIADGKPAICTAVQTVFLQFCTCSVTFTLSGKRPS